MNGQNLLEALNCIDENYIEQAAAPKRKRRWKTAAACAACLALLLTGAAALWEATIMNGAKTSQTEAACESVLRSAAPRADDNGAGIASYSMDTATLTSGTMQETEMTVRVLSQQGRVLTCTAVQSSRWEMGAQITLTLPDEPSIQPGTTLHVQYEMGETGPIALSYQVE